MKRFLKALKFAAEKHAGQRRKSKNAAPYINHPIEVAEHLATVGDISDEDILIAALLHDTVEDTDATYAEIQSQFGSHVADLVMECTDDKKLDKAERKRLQIVNAPHKTDGAKCIKIADKTSNLYAILQDPPKDWSLERQREYFQWAEAVVEGLLGVNKKLDEAVNAVLAKGKINLSQSDSLA